jgi:omega-6 fatty acid desaturase (delta-12 desaturase)
VSATRTTERELIDATRPFAVESRRTSVVAVITTFGLLVALTAGALVARPWPLRLALSVVEGLTIVRAFILFHDHLHGAILRRSRVARALFWVFGVTVMTPASVWRETHNYHHAHTAKIIGSHVGSYAMVTTEMWSAMSPALRLRYRLTRHPLTILLAYFTVFTLGMGIGPFLRAPRKHWSAGLTVAAHASAWTLALVFHVFVPFVFAFALPLFVACALGAYLFYAQHNFPDMHVQGRHEWTYSRAALESSSYMEMGPVMRYFAGNIGYHHVHHLNPLVPFYRLPEAMAAIPELQHPGCTSLRPREVLACLSLKLWDVERSRMVGYP